MPNAPPGLEASPSRTPVDLQVSKMSIKYHPSLEAKTVTVHNFKSTRRQRPTKRGALQRVAQLQRFKDAESSQGKSLMDQAMGSSEKSRKTATFYSNQGASGRRISTLSEEEAFGLVMPAGELGARLRK